MNILLTLNMNTFYCCWFKRDITKEKSESLRFHWSVSLRRESRYAGRDVTPCYMLFKVDNEVGLPAST
jgi:hypothetical protein